MKTALLRAFCGFFLCSAVPVFAAGPNLCQQQEDPLFACQLQNKKFVAACALYDPTLKQGYRSIVYRFGTTDHIELTLPDDPNSFRQTTYIDETTNYQPIEDDQYLRFVKGPFSYVLYTTDAKSRTLSGLAVFHDGKLLSTMKCQPETFEHDLSMNDLLALGVQPEVESKQAFRVWSQLLPKDSAVLAQRPFGALKYKLPLGKAR